MSWLSCANRIESPNCDDRPEGQVVDLLVIHSISLPPGQYGVDYVEQFFQNCLNPNDHEYFQEIKDLKVSSHLYIRRDGRVVQFVPFDKRAWHAGASVWQGRDRCNDYSIGIELEGCDDDEFTESQYNSLIKITKEIQAQFPEITDNRIVGHSDIAPDRKTDPGPCFNWDRYLNNLT